MKRHNEKDAFDAMSEMIKKIFFQTQEADNWGSGGQWWRQTRGWSMSRIVSQDRFSCGASHMDYLSSSLRHISHGRCDGLILLWTLSPTWTSCQLYMSIFNQIILKLSTCHHPGLWQNLLRVGISENFRSKLTCQHLAFVKNSQVYTSVKDWF